MKKSIYILGLSLILCGCGEDPPPKTIMEISSIIKKVDDTGSDLKIYIENGAALTADRHFQNTSMNTYRIVENLIKYFPDQVKKQVVFVVAIDTQDAYGNQKKDQVLELAYKGEDLKKVNFQNVYHRDLLELAAPVHYLNTAGEQAVNAWCREPENSGLRFCQKNT